MGKIAVLVTVLLVVSGTSRASPPPLADELKVKTCEVQCKPSAACTGAPNAGCAAARAECADTLRVGRRNVAPDRACAATLYHAACVWDPNNPSLGDAMACLGFARLNKTGWLFDLERDSEQHRVFVGRALDLAAARCIEVEGKSDFSGCVVAAQAAREHADLSSHADKDAAARYAERGCVGHNGAACVELAGLAVAGTDAESIGRKELAHKEAVDLCEKEHDINVCALAKYRTLVELKPGEARYAQFAPQFAAELVEMCKGDGHEFCAWFAHQLIQPTPRFRLKPDPKEGVAIAMRRCELGAIGACWVLAVAKSQKGPIEALRNDTEARYWAERTCMLRAPDEACAECAMYPDLTECKRRSSFANHDRCTSGDTSVCLKIVSDPKLVDPDLVPAAFYAGCTADKHKCLELAYLRLSCDGGDRQACDMIRGQCRVTTDPICDQALIHTDLFYVAESQLYTGGKPTLDIDTARAGRPNPERVVVGPTSASAGLTFRRGKLDADLVVDVVLDRARQAAIELVVRELRAAGKSAPTAYLGDLFEQGVTLLADASTLRREKFQDLGMTIVRAFVAASLVDGLYPTADALVAISATSFPKTDSEPAWHLELNAQFGASKHNKLVPGQALPKDVRRYLVDGAYQALGAAPLFRRASSGPAAVPKCPWAGDPGATLCRRMTEAVALHAMFRIDRVLDGLSLAQALRDAGFGKLRTLIEDVTASQSIADFTKTHGLNLAMWSKLVAASRDQFNRRGWLEDLRVLIRPSTYLDSGPELPELVGRAVGARAALGHPGIARLIGADHPSRVMRVISMIDQKADRKPAEEFTERMIGLFSAEVDTGIQQVRELRKEIRRDLAKWDDAASKDLDDRIAKIEKRLGALGNAADELDSAIGDIRRVFRGQRTPNAVLDIAELPLYALGDLATRVHRAARALFDIEVQLHGFVDDDRLAAQLRSARAASTRLLAFLDLMDRVARSAQVSRTCGEVVASLRALGSKTADGKFAAPLYDVLEPTLDAIKSHEPMSLDVLFAIIARVRLDRLVDSLQAEKQCADRVECWTVKLVHALQESVEREGDVMRIDGGKFARRLALVGDDLRRKHSWRSFFHLTVGVGGLYSDPVGNLDASRRSVPFISEQVGFGIASPVFGGNRFTFKLGAAGSGLLYRAVLDSEESNAIMLHPILFALDIGDLVEAYVSPAMVLLYPPDGMRDSAVRWAFGAGLSVPLGSYLERLR